MSEHALHIDIEGSGPPLVLLHGWGMHAGLFKPIIEILKDRFTFYSIDLPGHGQSNLNTDLSELDTLAHLMTKNIVPLVNGEFYLLGWSLGGLIAQRMAALYPALISRLILVSSSACFERKANWQYGIEESVLDQFSTELEKNYSATLDRFLALQFMGSAQQKNHLREARDLLAMKSTPNVSALKQGLLLLKNTDLRANLSEISCPCLILSGERDKLIPTKAIVYIVEQLAQARCYLFKGGSHAPFLSQTTAFTKNLEQFLL